MKKRFYFVVLLLAIFSTLSSKAQQNDQVIGVHHVANNSTMDNIASAQDGQLIFNLTDSLIYHFDGLAWIALKLGWSINGNAGVDAETEFLGSINSQDVKIETNSTQRMVFKADGKVGLNTNNPLGDFHAVQTRDFIITDKGRVGLGTTNPSQKLHVIGNILASGSIESSTPDYVFESYYHGYSSLNPSYTFMPLDQVYDFIKTHKHLPKVASAQEIEEKGGIVINEWTNQNLEKIEELFIHLIEMNKELKVLDKEIEYLEKN